MDGLSEKLKELKKKRIFLHREWVLGLSLMDHKLKKGYSEIYLG